LTVDTDASINGGDPFDIAEVQFDDHRLGISTGAVLRFSWPAAGDDVPQRRRDHRPDQPREEADRRIAAAHIRTSVVFGAPRWGRRRL
jgi:hypothetical protein